MNAVLNMTACLHSKEKNLTMRHCHHCMRFWHFIVLIHLSPQTGLCNTCVGTPTSYHTSILVCQVPTPAVDTETGKTN